MIEAGLSHADQISAARNRGYADGYRQGRRDALMATWACMVRYTGWLGKKSAVALVEKFFKENPREIGANSGDAR